MPTPFYHLSVAEEILHHPELDRGHRQLLEAERCNFLFGNTAPDVQTLSRQSREETHFFTLPVSNFKRSPWEELLLHFPSLADPRELRPDQAAFLTGYFCHLHADWLWIVDIFAPVFGPSCSWSTFRQRLYLHNVLRTYLDRRVVPALPQGIGTCLQDVAPSRWLPFVQDGYLDEWRDLLSRQLQPGAVSETAEVFAQRQGISPEEFYRLIESEERMEEEIFVHISRKSLDQFRQKLVSESLRLVQTYLSGSAAVEFLPADSGKH